MPQPYSDVEALIAAHPMLRNTVVMCGKGWFPIIARFAQAAAALPTKAPLRVDLIKSKYGELSMFLAGDGDEATRQALDELERIAEEASARTCEQCGSPGRQIEVKGWIHAACEACQPTP